ncbi:MAG TPA: ABC transporter permease subunit [Candidatus Tectomicrobia bacterium]
MARTVSADLAAFTQQRFQTSKATLLIDRCMTHGITVGGVTVIIAVLGIFVFILSQILPLFRGAHVRPLHSVPLPAQAYKILGADEWAELPLLVAADGTLWFVDLTGRRVVQRVDPGFDPAKTFSAFQYNQQRQDITYATTDGQFAIVKLDYKVAFDGYSRIVEAHPRAEPFLSIGRPGYAITRIAYGDANVHKLVAALQDVDGRLEVHAVSLVQKRTLLGVGKTTVGKTYDLTPHISGQPHDILVNAQADSIMVATQGGEVYYFGREGEALTLRQVFTPFKDLKTPAIASMGYLLGDVSLVFTSPSGANRLFSLYVPESSSGRLYGQTKTFSPLSGPASFYATSLRNKAFLIGHGTHASLRYATTTAVRWQETLPFTVSQALVGGKYNRLLFLDTTNTLHAYDLDDPHPEAGFQSLFGKIWYEGAPEPRYVWQSTGGSDDFEPKLSLIPVIIGALKGTLYAMFFAVPVALLAAIYTSQFLHPDLRIFVKPTMEIMASLPSVILGFLAALWLAPLVETRIPSLCLMLLFIPVSAVLFGWLWNTLPVAYCKWLKPGYEFLAFVPMLLLMGSVAWYLGPVLEQVLFVVPHPETGAQVGDFRLWWPYVTGTRFEQRNSLVVGFMMGFAVIPIVFTIAEDALSSVPPTLKSGSLALGASRWQTAIRVILPTASAGIFSALMIGLGRAVGETMIVLMATGNTPIMDFNIFTGMRTLSANIAVELPEAPHHGTLYRTLFLGGMVLFLLTFVMNTLAEILRQHLRERYKTI